MKESIGWTDHARGEAARRGIDGAIVQAIAVSPEQTEPIRPG